MKLSKPLVWKILELFFPPSSASEAVPLAANVLMKLPVFWPDAAKVLFAQVDAQFAIRNVTVSMTKFNHVVAVLPQEVASQQELGTQAERIYTSSSKR